MNSFRVYGSFVFCLMWAFVTSPTAFAGPYTYGPPTIVPAAGSYIPSPDEVPGKEYSNHLDQEGYPNFVADPEQNVAWDGIGGTRNAHDYSGSRVSTPIYDAEEREVDALANNGDALYTSVIANAAALLFSTDADPNIYVESIGGVGNIWATPAQINNGDWVSPGDVDGLEVWGADEEEYDDADRYSLEGDTVADSTGKRVSVFGYDVGSNNSNVAFYALDIAQALGNTNLTELIDVDAMMNYDGNIMFSLDPIAGFYDGGEIWVWDGVTVGGATFLDHGGHLWDTAFDVQGTFGTSSENINALEAVSAPVPEPASMLLFGAGLAGLVSYGRRRSQKKK